MFKRIKKMKIKLIFLGLLFSSMLNCMRRGTSFQPMPQPMPIITEFDSNNCEDYYYELNDLKKKLKEFKEKLKLLEELKMKAEDFAQSVKKFLDDFDSNFNQFNQNFNWQ